MDVKLVPLSQTGFHNACFEAKTMLAPAMQEWPEPNLRLGVATLTSKIRKVCVPAPAAQGFEVDRSK
jgi:hypothetical protein